jgi:DNA topoisomerase-1
MEEELDDIAEGKATRIGVLKDFYVPFSESLSLAEEKFERYLEELDELCPKCPTEGREPGRLQVRLGRFGKFIGCENFPECDYIRNLDGSERPEPELLDERCPDCGRQLVKKVGRFGPFVGCSGYPDCRYIKKEPPKGTGVTCPQCEQGELVEKRTRFGLMYGCDRYPECDCAVNNPPEKDFPCPECGGLLLRRPKSLRCWHCGAEVDLDMKVTKHGDREAEAAARAAKAEARKARAAAKPAASRKGSSRKTAAKKKKTPARKKTAARKRVSSAASAATAARGTSATADEEG